MKAAVIHGPGVVSYDTVADPIIKDTRDIILKVTATLFVDLICTYFQAVFHNLNLWYWVTSLLGLLKILEVM